MTSLPRKARSEFVEPTNFSDGRVRDSTRMFHVASAASHWPARNPTRGSGFGAGVAFIHDMSVDTTVGVTAVLMELDPCAQAASVARIAPNDAVISGRNPPARIREIMMSP